MLIFSIRPISKFQFKSWFSTFYHWQFRHRICKIVCNAVSDESLPLSPHSLKVTSLNPGGTPGGVCTWSGNICMPYWVIVVFIKETRCAEFLSFQARKWLMNQLTSGWTWSSVRCTSFLMFQFRLFHSSKSWQKYSAEMASRAAQ